jgi:hypothetical protein
MLQTLAADLRHKIILVCVGPVWVFDRLSDASNS